MDGIPKEMIVNASEGDIRAFEAIYRQSSSYVYNLAMRVLRAEQDSMEVTQDVFLSVHRNLKNFKFQSSFKTWVYRITINTALNHRKRWSKPGLKTVELNEWDGHSGTGAIEETIEREHHEKKISVLLSKLNPDQKACIILRNMEGLSYQEIAEVLQININTVRTRLKRAREILMSIRKEVMSNEM